MHQPPHNYICLSCGVLLEVQVSLTLHNNFNRKRGKKEIKRRKEITSPGSSAKPADGELHIA